MAIQGKPGGAATRVLPNPLATRPLSAAKPTQLLPEAKQANEDQAHARDLIRQFNEQDAARKQGQAQQAQEAQEAQRQQDLKQAQRGARFAAQHAPEPDKKPSFIDRWAGRLGGIPDPGSIVFPLLLILLLLFLVMRYGPKNLTRAELVWGVLVEDLQVQGGS